MTSGSRRGVTRGYVGGLIAAAGIVAIALLIAAWGLLSLLLDREPVAAAAVPNWTPPLIIAVALAALVWTLWLEALALLRGRRAPAWGYTIAVSLGAYLLWCLGGVLAGMSIEETWISPFAAAFVPIWAVVCLLFWGVLLRRVYTDRPPPRWPWERHEDEG